MPLDDHLEQIATSVNSIDNRLTAIESALKERCQNHRERMDGLQTEISDLKRRKGNGRSNGGNGVAALPWKAVLALGGAITALAAIIATLVAATLGGH